MSLRLRWIHCGRCNLSWFQALLVRLATRRTDPRRTLQLFRQCRTKSLSLSGACIEID